MLQRFSHKSTPKARQSAAQKLRASFGLTQEWLSNYLEVARSTVAMYEADRVNLPIIDPERLKPFLQGIPAPDGPAVEPSATPTASGQAAALASLTNRQRTARLEAERLEAEERRLQVRLRQVRLRLQTLPALLASLAPPPADELQRRVLGHWATMAPAQLCEDEAALPLLQVRRRVLAFELAELDQLLETEKSQAGS